MPQDLGDADDLAHRVCSCGLEAVTVGDRVRCPRCGFLRVWGVALTDGTLAYAPPGRRRPRRRELTASRPTMSEL